MDNKEMIAVIECYIHHKKNVQVRIAMPKTPNQYFLLSNAYEKCKDFFIKH